MDFQQSNYDIFEHFCGSVEGEDAIPIFFHFDLVLLKVTLIAILEEDVDIALVDGAIDELDDVGGVDGLEELYF